nr:hypothetical protein [Tanacetum cinerariifolium]
YKIDIDHANKVLSMQKDETKPAEVQEVVDVVTTAKLITKVVTAASETVTAASVIIPTAEPHVPAAILTAAPARIAVAPSRRRKGVVIRDPESESTTSTIIPAETNSKDKAIGACATLTKRVEHLEYDKVAQALEITKLKRRVKKLENRNKKDETKPAEVQEVVDVVTTAKLIIKVVTAASETVTAASVIIPTAEPHVPAAILTAAPARIAVAPSRRRKGVVIRDPESESTTSTIIPAETNSKDK